MPPMKIKVSDKFKDFLTRPLEQEITLNIGGY